MASGDSRSYARLADCARASGARSCIGGHSGADASKAESFPHFRLELVDVVLYFISKLHRDGLLETWRDAEQGVEPDSSWKKSAW